MTFALGRAVLVLVAALYLSVWFLVCGFRSAPSSGPNGRRRGGHGERSGRRPGLLQRLCRHRGGLLRARVDGEAGYVCRRCGRWMAAPWGGRKDLP